VTGDLGWGGHEVGQHGLEDLSQRGEAAGHGGLTPNISAASCCTMF
jgi:hypothetical protein